MSTLTRVPIRWMIRRDMPEVLAIESASFDYPWREDEFLRVLGQRNCIGMVAEEGKSERITGFMVYELHRDKIVMLDFAVHPELRRQGIGTQLMQKLCGKLCAQRRNRIVIHVRESNLIGQCFLRECRFLATEVNRGHYRDSGEDCYLMERAFLLGEAE